MATILKHLAMFAFQGADLTLATADFKNKLNTLYGINSEGGYTLFKPTSNFNSLGKLVQDGFYIVDGVAPLDIPGAVLTVPVAAPSTLVVGIAQADFTPLGGGKGKLALHLTAPVAGATVGISWTNTQTSDGFQLLDGEELATNQDLALPFNFKDTAGPGYLEISCSFHDASGNVMSTCFLHEKIQVS